MKVFLVLGSVALPILMYYVEMRWKRFRLIFNLLAIVAFLVFGNIASLSIYQIILDNTVMMTNIHAVFLNPYFLLSGSYIGVYLLYQLLKVTIRE